MRKTKIVATLGPATESRERLRQLLEAGVDVIRLNFSHGDADGHRRSIRRIREAAEALDRPIAILQDLQGPKIRTGSLVGGGPVELIDGRRLVITTEQIEGTSERVSTGYAALPGDVAAGDTILVSDGELELEVETVSGCEVVCRVVHGGMLKERQGMNLPGVALSTPALTGKDRADLVVGLDGGVDYVALSFVRRPEDVAELRECMKAHGRVVPIIAKLEKPEAIA